MPANVIQSIFATITALFDVGRNINESIYFCQKSQISCQGHIDNFYCDTSFVE